MTRTRHPLKRLGFRLVFVSLLLIPAALILTELLMRVIDLRPPRFPPRSEFRTRVWEEGGWVDAPFVGGRRLSPFEEVQWGEWIPGVRIQTLYPDNPRNYFDADCAVEREINALGLAGPEITAEKPGNVYRILALGDSLTFGEGVFDRDTFARRLERGLNAGGPGGGRRRHEVLNAGIGGYNTLHEAIYLERRWLSLRPDLVLIVFYVNDAYPSDFICCSFTGSQNRPQGIGRWSRLYDYVQFNIWTRRENQALAKHYQRPMFSDPAGHLFKPMDELPSVWPVSFEGLKLAARLRDAHGFRLGLVIFPELYELNDRHPFLKFYEYLTSVCDGLNIPTLNLFDAFKGRDPGTLWVHPADHHPNDEGHRIAAGAIEPFVRELMK